MAGLLKSAWRAVVGSAAPSDPLDLASLAAPVQAPDSVRFVAISDTHGHHRELALPAGDVLLHAGDMTRHGTVAELEDFNEWLGEVGREFKHVLVIGGNHDLAMDPQLPGGHTAGGAGVLTHCQLLTEEATTVLGVKVFGSAAQPRIGRKYVAFVSDNLESAWAKVPTDTDIILSHAPPRGHGDLIWGLQSGGCDELLAACERIKPRFVVFGHIHAGYGVTTMNDGVTVCINAASMRPTRVVTGLNKPVVFDVQMRT